MAMVTRIKTFGVANRTESIVREVPRFVRMKSTSQYTMEETSILSVASAHTANSLFQMEPFHAMENAKNTQKDKKYLRYVGKMKMLIKTQYNAAKMPTRT